MRFGPSPVSADDRRSEIVEVAVVLGPVLAPLEFAPAQVSASGPQGQVIFCRGLWHSTDGGCVDLVIDLVADPDWRIVDVRYCGFTSDRWHLDFDRRATLGDQLANLAQGLPRQLS
ncbi:MAG: hypothetical protein R2761_20780 [Acidimicrobiales bacterium]